MRGRPLTRSRTALLASQDFLIIAFIVFLLKHPPGSVLDTENRPTEEMESIYTGKPSLEVDFSVTSWLSVMRREQLSTKPLQLFGIPGIPKIEQGDDLSKIILEAVRESRLELLEGDILIIAHSVISKAEGRVVHQDTVKVSERARAIAEANGFDPVHVELALQESKRVLRSKGVLVTETHSGLVCNFSGVDRSNAPVDCFLLLPQDPDASAFELLKALQAETGLQAAVIISDTHGRPWRMGSVNVALGCAGIGAFKHNRGKKDLYGRIMRRSTVCQIDELAAAAEPLMGQADDAVPVVIVRGYEIEEDGKVGRDVQRTAAEDLFR